MNLRAAVLLAGILAGSAFAGAPDARVCPDPAKPCARFKPHELSFALVNDGVARADQRSAPFFAVILKTLDRCAKNEAERVEIQALFPAQKVFATRFDCGGEENVTYSNTDPRHGFIAVYGGETRAVAAEVLAHAKMFKRFDGANLRSMQVIYLYP